MSTATTWTPQPGRVGNLTPEQQKALDDFRELLKSEGLFVVERGDDATLLRFLRARKFDIKLAKDMFAACEKWRKEFGANDLIKCVSLTYLLDNILTNICYLLCSMRRRGRCGATCSIDLHRLTRCPIHLAPSYPPVHPILLARTFMRWF